MSSLKLVVLIALAAAPLWAASPAKRLRALIADGSWLSAGELAREMIESGEGAGKAEELLRGLEEKARQDAENADFNPRNYFYAQAYFDYFHKKRYKDAVEDLEQVLSFELENEEALRFMDKAQVLAEQETRDRAARQQKLLRRARELFDAGQAAKALTVAERAVAEVPANAEAQELLDDIRRLLEPPPLVMKPSRQGKPLRQVLRQAKALPPPDPAWLESRYREALKAYVAKELDKAAAILNELLRRDPGNERWKKTLERIGKELPRSPK